MKGGGRTRRIGENEALFRSVNERIGEIGGAFSIYDEPLEFLCECGYEDCVERVSLRPSEYERVRADPERFFMVEGHQIPAVEHVVDRIGGCIVVEKEAGEPAEIARRLDERT